ncbi:MAG: ferritin-like domain-containing protein [Allosphingosinicella sp.]
MQRNVKCADSVEPQKGRRGASQSRFRPRLLARARRRYLDILASVYIYNEHRGYRSIDRVLDAVRGKYPGETAFLGDIEKHRRDERQHYLMFRRYFETLGEMPYEVDRTCGHIDRLIRLIFGFGIDDLDTDAVIDDPELFEKLCRVIVLTEMRGMRQVEILLNSPLMTSDRALVKIFKVIERDEPSHWAPYLGWIKAHSGRMPSRSERLADAWVHRSLILFKLPLLYLNPRLRRRTTWADAGEGLALGGLDRREAAQS